MSLIIPNFKLLDNKNRKTRRMYQRMMTGVTIATNKQRDIRFMTLTTAKERRFGYHFQIIDGVRKKVQNLMPRTPKDSFDILRQRIKRATVLRDGFTGFNLNKYYCLKTSEGNGVLHIIFHGGLYLPQNWLSQQWYEIHGAYEADIRKVNNIKKSLTGLVGYLIDNYLMKQPVERMSYGWGWAWLGFCKSWDKIKQQYGRVGLKKRFGVFIFPGIPSWHRYFYDTYYGWKPPKWEKYQLKRDCTQTIKVWNSTLADSPTTSRQTKFFYNSRGFQNYVKGKSYFLLKY